MSVRVWLVRHGETDWNAVGRFTGWTDVALTDRGREQARVLARVLADRRFDGVWSSDLIRAVETARIVADEPRTDHRLREIDFGEIEGLTWDQLDPDTRQALKSFDGFQAPGGESMAGLRHRVLSFLAELPPGDHLVVTHGGVVKLLARECASDGFPGNAELVVLDWTGRRRIQLDLEIPSPERRTQGS